MKRPYKKPCERNTRCTHGQSADSPLVCLGRFCATFRWLSFMNGINHCKLAAKRETLFLCSFGRWVTRWVGWSVGQLAVCLAGVCLAVWLSDRLAVWLSGCLAVWLFVWFWLAVCLALSRWLSVCLRGCLCRCLAVWAVPVCLCLCIYVCLCLLVCVPMCLCVCVSVCLCAFVPACLPAFFLSRSLSLSLVKIGGYFAYKCKCCSVQTNSQPIVVCSNPPFTHAM